MSTLFAPGQPPWAILAVTGASLFCNGLFVGYLVLNTHESPSPAAKDPAGSVAQAVGAAHESPVQAAMRAPSAQPPVAPVPATTEPTPYQSLTASVDGSIAQTFARAIPKHADALNAVYARLFFWDVDVRRDVRPGDQLSVLYEWNGQLPSIVAATYTSAKLGTTLRAYAFQATGDAHVSYWNEQGIEVPRRLLGGPITHYEQITSLIKDRPTHKGMDFKTPVGTQVVSPKAAKVLRTNWNVRYNGNCAELKYPDGTLARFLHLSETSVQPGHNVSAGEQLGLSGNTGRSTAPHLHYELEQRGKLLDPVDYHGVERRSLAKADQSAFQAQRQRLDQWLQSPQG